MKIKTKNVYIYMVKQNNYLFFLFVQNYVIKKKEEELCVGFQFVLFFCCLPLTNNDCAISTSAAELRT